MRRFGLVAIAVVVLAGCVGVEHPVSDAVYGPDGTDQRETAGAFDGTNFLVVWLDARHGGDIYGARVRPDGSVLDVTGIPIARRPHGGNKPDVTFDGVNFLVVWGAGQISGARVSPAGVVLDPNGFPISSGPGFKSDPAVIAASGGTSLVVWNRCDPSTGCDPTETTPPLLYIEGARVSRAGAVVGPQITIATGYHLAPDVGSDGTSFLVTWQQWDGVVRSPEFNVMARRVSSAGSLIGQPISVAAAETSEVSPSLAFDGTNYLAVWKTDPGSAGSRIRGARITSAGAVLDSLGFDISTSSADDPTVVFDGTNYLATWDYQFTSGTVLGRRVSTSGSPLGVVLAIGSGVRPAVAAGAGLALAVFESNEVPLLASVEGVRISAATVLDDPPIPLTNPANNQVEPAIAFDGTNHLVVWADRRPAPNYDIYSERVGGDGTKLDGAGIAVSTAPGYQVDPAVAFNGTEYFVVWVDYRAGGSATDIYGARVTPAGVVLDPGGIPIATTSNDEIDPAVASDGHNFFVVWELAHGGIHGARVSPSGTVLDPNGLVISSGTSAWRSAIAYGAGSYLVVWQQLPQNLSDWDIAGARVGTSGSVLDHNGIVISSAPNAQGNPAIAFDGSNHLVVWEDQRSDSRGGIYGSRVTPAGSVLDASGIPVSTAAGAQLEPAVAANGRFLVVWRDDRGLVAADADDIVGARVDDSGVVRDPSGFAITSSNDLESEPAVAAGIENGWEVAYRRFAPERIYGADRVFHRRVVTG